MSQKQKILLTLLLGLIILCLLPFFGGERLSFSAMWDFSNPNLLTDRRILYELRFPRLALVLMAGGVLAVLGASYQILFANPLAEPYILGVSSAVTLGAVVAELFLKWAPHSLPVLGLGFMAALLVTLLLVVSPHAKLGTSMERVVLFGMGVNFLLSSILFLILSYRAQGQGGAGGSMRWLFGGIPWISSHELFLYCALSFPFLLFLFLLGRSLDALSLGDSVSRSMGFQPETTRRAVLFVTSVSLAIIVAITGAIGFVGLVVPHCVRLIYRPSSTRILFSYSFFLGALFLAFSDGLSRAIFPPFEFPIGIITAILGAPIFLVLLWKR